MADYLKATSISFTAQSDSDDSLPVAEFNRQDLIDFLSNTATTDTVAVAFRRTSNTTSGVQLLIAGVNGSGAPNSEEIKAAAICPPACYP